VKILWLSHLIPYPPKGGVLQRSYHLVNELAKYHEVDLLAFNQHGLIGPLFDSVATGVREADAAMGKICRRHRFFEIPSEVRSGGKYALALQSLVTAPYNINWLRSTEYADAVRAWTRDKQYDVIHFDTISLIPFFDCIPPNTTTVLDHHNIESHMLLRRAGNEPNALKKFYFWQEGVRLQHYEKKYCPQFSLNITCSDVDTERLRELSPASKVVTVPNGVDLDYFKPLQQTRNGKRLIFVGTMNWYPNIEAVMYIADHIWPALKAKHADLEIDIIGANPPDSIRNLVQRLPGFNVHGFVDDVRPYIDNAAVYVCPIRDGGGTKLKILDAMAMAKALVAHPIACEGIAVSNGSNVSFAETPDAFVQAVDNLLRNPDNAHAMGQRARELMEATYGYHSIGQKFAGLLQDCARERRN